MASECLKHRHQSHPQCRSARPVFANILLQPRRRQGAMALTVGKKPWDHHSKCGHKLYKPIEMVIKGIYAAKKCRGVHVWNRQLMTKPRNASKAGSGKRWWRLPRCETRDHVKPGISKCGENPGKSKEIMWNYGKIWQAWGMDGYGNIVLYVFFLLKFIMNLEKHGQQLYLCH